MNIEQIKLVSERYYQLYLQGQAEKYALMEKKLTINFNPPPPLHPTEEGAKGGIMRIPSMEKRSMEQGRLLNKCDIYGSPNTIHTEICDLEPIGFFVEGYCGMLP